MERPSLESIYGIPEKQTSSRPSLESIYGIGSSTPEQPKQDPFASELQRVGVPNVQAQPQPEKRTFLESLKQNIVDPFSSRFGKINYSQQGIVSDTIQSVGAVAGGITGVVGNVALSAAKAVTPDPIEKTVGDVVSSVGGAVSSAIPQGTKDAFSSWAQQHPEAAANLGAFVDIASIVPLFKGAGALKTAASLESNASRLAMASKSTGRVIQSQENILPRTVGGVTTQRPIAQDVLSKLDTSKVKTYSELSNTITESNKSKLIAVSDYLKTDTTKYRIENFEINKSGIVFNPVKDAMTGLKELGVKTSDVDLLAKIKPFEIKLARGEMTQLDVNELAKILGNKQNAFSQSGNILKSTNAVKSENTRVSLKEIARQGMPDDVRRIDMEISDSIAVQKAVDRMRKKVVNEINASENLGVFGKTTRGAAHIADLFTGRLVGSVIRELRSKGRLSPIEIEKELAKNLKNLNQATQAKDINRLKQIYRGVGLIGGATVLNKSTDPKQEK